MPLARRAVLNFENMNFPVSYRISETGQYFRDALNVVSNQGRLETRFGTSRYNSTELPSAPVSITYFEKSDGSRYILAKCGDSIYSVSESGAHTLLKSGLSATSKHRSVTANDRAIICVEGDGLYSFNGTLFTQLGQSVPPAPTAAAYSSGGTLPTASYQCAWTYYSESTGFETNIGTSSGAISVTLGHKIQITSAAPAQPANATMSKAWLYLKSGTGDWFFVAEYAFGAAVSDIVSPPASAQTPPIDNATPPTDAKYITWYDGKVVVTGTTANPNDVFFSERDLPDAWSDLPTNTVLFMPGDGAPSGLATGFFSDSTLDPYLIVFKKRLCSVFSEITSTGNKFTVLDSSIGCASPDTIQVRNGDVYFLSETGWRVISNGTIVKDKDGNVVTLGAGRVDDIFNSPGFDYAINKSDLINFHSIYSGESRTITTFVSEGLETVKNKAYAYEFESKGFKPFYFPVSVACSCQAENSAGVEISLLGTTNGYLLKHSRLEDRTDKNILNEDVKIKTMAQLAWFGGGDYDSSYNFRALTIRAISSAYEVLVKAWVDFSFQESTDTDFSFSNPNGGFILDVSILDEDILTDNRSPAIYQGDLNRRGQNICIGFYQEELNANLGLQSLQIDFSKNGNRN